MSVKRWCQNCDKKVKAIKEYDEVTDEDIYSCPDCGTQLEEEDFDYDELDFATDEIAELLDMDEDDVMELIEDTKDYGMNSGDEE